MKDKPENKDKLKLINIILASIILINLGAMIISNNREVIGMCLASSSLCFFLITAINIGEFE